MTGEAVVSLSVAASTPARNAVANIQRPLATGGTIQKNYSKPRRELAQIRPHVARKDYSVPYWTLYKLCIQ